MDTKLSCSAGNCVHNINGLCAAREIQVTGLTATTSNATQCNTFAERNFKNAFTNLANMNVVGEAKQLFARNSSVEMSPKIACDAQNCLYNKNKICNASSVQINGLQAQTSELTQCETFRQS
ncbi:DUF1540 domain-containing protein [Clostridium ganghwense]|uniref:DUF1540 domain-containing protein n=1 Tax=Clostridium ganghwense TaxID=312089 RepID=A0ABT4CT79_9CLOT|nr:DUF1540 domain-containing protein [Clostridium ganghwense]MCY6371251.1 DUF1540 domain-containing protein [Clostridium ganghwense]